MLDGVLAKQRAWWVQVERVASHHTRGNAPERISGQDPMNVGNPEEPSQWVVAVESDIHSVEYV